VVHSIERSVDVDATLAASFSSWMRLDELRHYLPGVRRLARTGRPAVAWTARIGGREVSGEAEMTALVPGRRIAWHGEDGLHHTGSVQFEPLGPERTRIVLRLAYDPPDVGPDPARLLAVLNRCVQRGLARAKRRIERSACYDDAGLALSRSAATSAVTNSTVRTSAALIHTNGTSAYG
jgi:uncharacterized membrane protein